MHTCPVDQMTGTAHVVDIALSLDPSKITRLDFMPIYAAHLRAMIKQAIDAKDNFDRPLEGFKIVVDAGNGAGGFFATDVLAELGADVSPSQFLEPDGMFPNHMPNPEDQGAADSVSRAVLESGKATQHCCALAEIFESAGEGLYLLFFVWARDVQIYTSEY